jgi:hypothetical protein
MLTGCSVYPHEIPREYASANKYRLYNCDHVERESYRIDVRATQLAATLEKYAQSDPPLNGLALWPEYARLKGEHAALHKAAAARGCAVPTRVRMGAPPAGMEIEP